jgi:hypothetical protein
MDLCNQEAATSTILVGIQWSQISSVISRLLQALLILWQPQSQISFWESACCWEPFSIDSYDNATNTWRFDDGFQLVYSTKEREQKAAEGKKKQRMSADRESYWFRLQALNYREECNGAAKGSLWPTRGTAVRGAPGQFHRGGGQVEAAVSSPVVAANLENEYWRETFVRGPGTAFRIDPTWIMLDVVTKWHPRLAEPNQTT